MDNSQSRNSFVTFWLLLILVANVIMFVYGTSMCFRTGDASSSLLFGISAFFSLVNLLGAIMLLRWLRVGFYLFCASSLASALISFLTLPAFSSLGGIISVIVLFAVLRLKSGEQSTWSQLKSGFDWKHGRHIYQTFIVLGAVLLASAFIVYGQKNNILLEQQKREAQEQLERAKKVLEEKKEQERLQAVKEAEEKAAKEAAAKEAAEKAAAAKAAAAKEAAAKEAAAKKAAQAHEEEMQRKERELQRKEQELKQLRQEEERRKAEQAMEEAKTIEAAREFLKAAIVAVEVPQNVGNGMYITSYSLSEDYLEVICEVNEKVIKIDDLNAQYVSVRDGIKSSFSDPSTKAMLGMCTNAHVGLKYIYTGNKSRKVSSYSFSYAELLEWL